MTVQTQIRQVAGAPSIARVNLMPPEIEESRRFRKVQAGLGGAMVAAVAAVAALYVLGQGGVSSAQQRLDAAKAQQQTLLHQQAALQNVSQVYADVASHQAMLSTAMGQEVQWSHYLNDLALRVPDNVWLTNVAITENVDGTQTASTSPLIPSGIGTVTFTGRGFTHDDVAAWLDSLAKEKGYASPYFSSSTEDQNTTGKKLVTFTSTVTLTNDALSGRFTKPAGS